MSVWLLIGLGGVVAFVIVLIWLAWILRDEEKPNGN